MVFQVEQCMFQVEHVSLAKEANGFFGTILVSIYLHESHYISFEVECSRDKQSPADSSTPMVSFV